jgi:ribosomal protein S27AE
MQGGQFAGDEDGGRASRRLAVDLSRVRTENQFPPRIECGAGFFLDAL